MTQNFQLASPLSPSSRDRRYGVGHLVVAGHSAPWRPRTTSYRHPHAAGNQSSPRALDYQREARVPVRVDDEVVNDAAPHNGTGGR